MFSVTDDHRERLEQLFASLRPETRRYNRNVLETDAVKPLLDGTLDI